MSGTDDALANTRRDYRAPYGGKNHIPTVRQYRQHRQNLLDRYSQTDDDTAEHSNWGWKGAYDWWYGGEAPNGKQQDVDAAKTSAKPNSDGKDSSAEQSDQNAVDTSQVASNASDPKARRKEIKHGTRSRAERNVTDPVTHMPVTIHDYTDKDLKEVDEGEATPSGLKRLTMKLRGKTDTGLSQANDDQTKDHMSLQQLFPPPDYELLKEDLDKVYLVAIGACLGGIVSICGLSVLGRSLLHHVTTEHRSLFLEIVLKWILLSIAPAVICVVIFLVTQQWARRHSRDLLEDDIWHANADFLKKKYSHTTETTIWLNEFLGSVWPLVNPDLFLSLADTLEDVMQASLPSLIRMVSVEDLGQGSESMRILGVKWLPRAASAMAVTTDGALENQDEDDSKNSKRPSSRSSRQSTRSDSAPPKAHEQGKSPEDAQKSNEEAPSKEKAPQANSPSEEETQDADGDGVMDGMEAEDGDFVNLEIAFAYKPREQRKTFRDRSKNAHLLVAFYLPGNIKIPVWVELRGFVGTLRMRSQLTPDPPFLALSTITLLGQPKVDVSCIPLTKRGLNIMDVPLISNFVQSAIDAAVSEYVAPKSLTLDLKAMLAGDDFKKDTSARGVLVVRVKRAFDFKAGDMSIPLLRDGSSDGYVSVGWAKFGKPLFSTRVIINDMEPWWDEEAQILVGPEELDAGESLRLQLWDSDRMTADDDLGRIEVPLKTLMRNENSNGKMWERVDSFKALKAGESMPGRCEWSVGYFSKTRLLDYQLNEQTIFPKCHSVEELQNEVYRKAERKLRQAVKDESAEIDQLKEDDLKAAQVEIIGNTRPPEEYPSGILSIQIHQITGLGIEPMNRSRDDDGGEAEGEEEDADTLPSAYATIIMNGKKTYKTRVKPKNAKPFYNAGCERYLRDWRTAELYVSVRDARVHENDPLLGIVYLPLAKLLRDRKTSHFHEFFPITGGIGHGRVRISCVFRSVQMQAPGPALGWEYGTVRVEAHANGSQDLPSNLHGCKLHFRTTLGHSKMVSQGNASGQDGSAGWSWSTRKGRPLMLAVRKRHSVCMLIEFRHTSRGLFGGDKSPAFAVLWLNQIPDDEKQEISLPVFKGDMWRAAANALPEEKRGDRLGEIKLNVTFLRGIGHWHRSLAKRNQDVANVLEVLECAADNDLIKGIVGEGVAQKKDSRITSNHQSQGAENDDVQTTDGPDSSSDEEDQPEEEGTVKAEDDTNDETSNSSMTEANDENAHSSKSFAGIKDEVKSYNRHKRQLHRRQRGAMQWKGVRTVDWVKSKTGSISKRLSGAFEHKERQPDIETEV